MAPKNDKPTEVKLPVQFYSRAAGLHITFKRPTGRPDGTTQPGEAAHFQKHYLTVTSKEMFEFLMTRTANGSLVYGTDYWLVSDMEKYLKQVPGDQQFSAQIRMRDDKISRLTEELDALKAKHKES